MWENLVKDSKFYPCKRWAIRIGSASFPYQRSTKPGFSFVFVYFVL